MLLISWTTTTKTKNSINENQKESLKIVLVTHRRLKKIKIEREIAENETGNKQKTNIFFIFCSLKKYIYISCPHKNTLIWQPHSWKKNLRHYFLGCKFSECKRYFFKVEDLKKHLNFFFCPQNGNFYFSKFFTLYIINIKMSSIWLDKMRHFLCFKGLSFILPTLQKHYLTRRDTYIKIF